MAKESLNKCTSSDGSKSSWRWTNEKHLRFLNSIEESFVRTMLQKASITRTTSTTSADSLHLPLDRYLPDTCESTLDLHKPRRRRYSASDILEERSEKKKTKKLVPRRVITSEDQVVPNGKKGGGGGSGGGGRTEEKSKINRTQADLDGMTSE